MAARPLPKYLAATWLAISLQILAVLAQTQTSQTETDTSTTTFRTRTRATDTTIYVEPVTYTAPASCPTPFTVETVKEVSVPLTAAATLTPTSTERGYYLTNYVTAYLPPGAIPATAATTDYVYRYYLSDCTNPTAYFGTGSGSSGSTNSDTSPLDSEVCLRRYTCFRLRTWIIVLASVLPTLFLLGFVESFFWFRRLMHGRRALRLGTTCWALMSLWVLCFTRTAPARHPDDRPALRAQWAAMSAGTKWRLWWRWGFRHKYPVDLLGPDPRYPPATAPAGTAEEGEAPKEGVRNERA